MVLLSNVLEISDLVSLVALVLSLVSLIQTRTHRRHDKKLEITRIYLERYGNLAREAGAVGNDEFKKEVFYQMYWFLQQEQYLFWRKDLIDKNLFDIWMNYRIVEWSADMVFGVNRYRECYKKAKALLLPEFCRFIEEVFSRQKFGKFQLGAQ